MFARAITDRSIVPYPATPPDPGPAGNIIIDPFCENRIVRATDQATAYGHSFSGNSSAESNPWSADSTMFLCTEREAGGSRLCQLDPDTLQVTYLGTKKWPSGFGPFSFGYQDPCLLWGYQDLTLKALNISTEQVKTLIDLRTVPQLGIPASPRWFLHSLDGDYSDRRVCCCLGEGQDKSYLLIVYDLDQGLSYLNTQTGQFFGFGSIEGQASNWTPYKLHDCRSALTGSMIRSGGAGLEVQDTRVFWKPGTQAYDVVKPSATIPMHGHVAMGFTTHFGGILTTVPFQFISLPIWKWEAYTQLMNPVPEPIQGFWSDYYLSVLPDFNDNAPLFISTVNVQGNPTVPGKPPTSICAADNEIFALSTDGSGKWFRLAHHYSTGQKSGTFYSIPVLSVSPDGRFVLFTSDWEMTTGGTYPNQRSDAYVLETGYSRG
jgi:hypothetical protein